MQRDEPPADPAQTGRRSARVRARRRPDRAAYDRAAVYAALDEGVVAHVAWVLAGQPFATPTAYVRDGDALVWHGSAHSRMIAAALAGDPLCVTVSRIDGLVAGRSGFAHSINYTSVMAFGRAAPVEGERKRRAMEAFVDRLYPGRSALLRPATRAELAQITVVRMPIDEAARKVRAGPPARLAADDGWDVWSGVLPVRAVVDAPEDGTGPEPYAGRAGADFAALLRAAARG